MYPDQQPHEWAQLISALFCVALSTTVLGMVIGNFLWKQYRKYSTWKKRTGRANGYIKPSWTDDK